MQPTFNFLIPGSKSAHQMRTVSKSPWVMTDKTNKIKGAAIVFRNNEGCVLAKKYDSSFRRIIVGKWVLFDADGVCIGQCKFSNKIISTPPFQWADQKLRDQKFLKSHGF